MEPTMETWVDRETIHKGAIFSVVKGQVRLDDGQLAGREVVVHHGGVAVVPVLDDCVILIRQFRIAVGREMLELPAGRLEGDEPPEYRARRELEEEIGYTAGKLTLAASYFSSAGFTDERMSIFLAFDLAETAVSPEFDERIEPVKIPLTALPLMLANHEIEDAKTLIGLRELLAYLST
jgi:ADP-ribose pyrophosphatase